ncbi:hypothetical protein FHR32_001499 [Streptosporangium album]|uniref:Tat pathway signal sequence domain protein n=1 Tax=Streptosporangium album TaxID=47479 RepID=A0A7W7RS54_9ACTN|nr:Tat pathway signal sequence domain protein [Streptosporangium album]MBB4937194.1 hypothetical protein [Streptosporangium album]
MGRRRIVMALAGAGVAAAAGAAFLLSGGQGSQAAGVAPRVPAPGDPLTGEEITRATGIASATLRAHMTTGQVDLLYVERDDDKDVEQRRADAYLYDYAADKLIVRTVDLGQGKVVEETATRGVQPPPSAAEEVRAAELLLADPAYGTGVRESYARASGGGRLRSAADLGLRGLIFVPGQESGGEPCRTHRCVRLFVRFPGATWLDTSRIAVDLSAKKIYTLEW